MFSYDFIARLLASNTIILSIAFILLDTSKTQVAIEKRNIGIGASICGLGYLLVIIMMLVTQ